MRRIQVSLETKQKWECEFSCSFALPYALQFSSILQNLVTLCTGKPHLVALLSLNV